ncbi:NAD-dependent protein deacetylase [Paenibacillus segetis]|uniref:protein acetyllysine N-acetyltransferase n=2 Tax=Paenibacillus segetis TaxID=1325360 RepID=A0ABQ1Y4M8_9BACL|nr:NAD-dependent protein deacetylase [Paenibacillus segetis]
MDLLDYLKAKIQNSNYPVVITGPRITFPSDTLPFKANYFGHSLNDILSLDFLQSNYEIFIKTCILIGEWNKKKPNYIHESIKELDIPIITENIDMLHTIAGSKKVIQLLGNIQDFVCTKCNFSIPFFQSKKYINIHKPFYCPECHSPIKLNIVLKGEAIRNFHHALNEIYKADTLLILGSDLDRWPINKLNQLANKQGSKIIIINEFKV